MLRWLPLRQSKGKTPLSRPSLLVMGSGGSAPRSSIATSARCQPSTRANCGRTPVGAGFSGRFDEDALTEDLERLPASAGNALREFRKELREAGGIPKSRLKACHDEGQDGTMLGGCVKTYVPWPNGRFGVVFVAVTHPNRAMGT
jgi:hypothetical protein